MSLSDYQNGGAQSRANSAAYASKSAIKTGDTPVPPANTSTYNARGEATSFDANTTQYDIKQYQYPNDLMSAPYGQNYVVFYINVSNDSKLVKDNNSGINTTDTVADFSPRDQGELAGMKISQGQATFASGAEGLLVGGAAGAVLGGKEGAGKAALGVAGLSALGVAAVGTQTSTFTKQQKRLKTAIAMHIPNTLSIRYGTNWGEEDTKNFAMLAAGGEAIMKAVTSGSVKGGIDQLSGPAKAIAAAIALDKLPGKEAVSAATGLASNPRKEQVFKSVDFRTFQFEYQFFPRDPAEAKNVLNIIKQFKYHMHPEFKDSSNFIYIYPSEFDIYYYQGTTENMNVHRHTSCVLTEMTVNYAPQGQFTSFDNGMPTQINITLNFRELALLTKEKIQDGF